MQIVLRLIRLDEITEGMSKGRRREKVRELTPEML